MLYNNTGLRGGELWGLQAGDFIEKDNILYVCRQFNRLTGKIDKTKTRRSRYVPCNSLLKEEILLRISQARLTGSDFLFYTKKKSPIDHTHFVKRRFKKDLKEWGGKQIRFHDTRHTAITLMVASGIDIKTVQAIAGHSQISTANFNHNELHSLSGRKCQKCSKKFCHGTYAYGRKDHSVFFSGSRSIGQISFFVSVFKQILSKIYLAKKAFLATFKMASTFSCSFFWVVLK